ncbi:hypothetical protein [Streptosporangium longisporum]
MGTADPAHLGTAAVATVAARPASSGPRPSDVGAALGTAGPASVATAS